MKFIIAFVIATSFATAAPNAPKKTQPLGNGRANETALKEKYGMKEPNSLDKKQEDCDEKAKKPIEITPESISLSGTTGCSLDENPSYP